MDSSLDRVSIPPIRHRSGQSGSRLWREWCFLRVAFRHFRVRFLLMAAILLLGGWMFILCEPEKQHSLPRAIFYTWSLVFGEPPEAFPDSVVLKTMFFLVPILGLTVIIEGIIDFALMLRDRRRYERSWCMMLASSFHDHVVLVGLGRLGNGTFRLLRKMGEAVVVIERDGDGEFIEDLRQDGSPLLIGDARREALLESANIARARSIVLATDDDLTNLEVALDARRLNPRIRVVLRMFDPLIARKIGEGFDIDSAMSQAALSAPSFATAALQPSIVNSFVVNDRLVVMQRWLVRRAGPLCGKTCRQIVDEMSISIVEHRPAGAGPTLFPRGETVMEAGDGLIVQGPFDVIAALKPDVMGVTQDA